MVHEHIIPDAQSCRVEWHAEDLGRRLCGGHGIFIEIIYGLGYDI